MLYIEYNFYQWLADIGPTLGPTSECYLGTRGILIRSGSHFHKKAGSSCGSVLFIDDLYHESTFRDLFFGTMLQRAMITCCTKLSQNKYKECSDKGQQCLRMTLDPVRDFDKRIFPLSY